MQKNQKITTEFNGQTIEGVIVIRTHCDLRVDITTPYSGLTNYSHIPYFAAGKCDFRTSYGDVRAESLLLDSYDLAVQLSRKLPVLRDKWKAFQDKINVIEDGEDAEALISFNIRQLRAELKAGTINPRNYQRTLTSLKTRRSNREIAVGKVADQFFDEHAAYVIPLSTRAEVVELLRGERETLLSITAEEERLA